MILSLALTYIFLAVFCAWLLWMFEVECSKRKLAAVAFVVLGPVLLAAVVVCSIVQGVYRQLWKRN